MNSGNSEWDKVKDHDPPEVNSEPPEDKVREYSTYSGPPERDKETDDHPPEAKSRPPEVNSEPPEEDSVREYPTYSGPPERDKVIDDGPPEEKSRPPELYKVMEYPAYSGPPVRDKVMDILLIAEAVFAHNSKLRKDTKLSPFQLVRGKQSEPLLLDDTVKLTHSSTNRLEHLRVQAQ